MGYGYAEELDAQQIADGQRTLLANRFLREQTKARGPQTILAGGGRQRAAADHLDAARDFLAQFEDLAALLLQLRIDQFFAVENLEEARRFQRAIQRAAPSCPKRAPGTRHLHGLVMLEGRERLRDDGVGAVRTTEHGGEIIVERGPRRIPGIAVGVQFDGSARLLEIPAREVEEMDWL